MKYSKTFFIALLLAFSPTQVIAAENIESAISEREQEINSWLTSQEDNMLNLLERITNINSGTLNKAGVDEMSAIFNDELSLLGFSISTLPGDLIAMPSCPGSDYNIDVSDHLLATKSGEGPKFLLIGHLDTVFH